MIRVLRQNSPNRAIRCTAFGAWLRLPDTEDVLDVGEGDLDGAAVAGAGFPTGQVTDLADRIEDYLGGWSRSPPCWTVRYPSRWR